jgi:aminoglycoside phosphotransferase (APT) family kinase protein
MCEDLVDHLVRIHAVDLEATGLIRLGDPTTYLDRELARWSGEMRRVQRGPLPALERLLAELHERRPPANERVSLVHGDAKPGNVAFVGDRVSAVFDWEMADVGDPLADLGYLELMWGLPVGITSRPSAPTFDAMVARYEEATGAAATDRPWYLALEAFKTAVILLVGSMLFDAGHTDDVRNLEMAFGVDMTTQVGLAALGVTESLEAGPVMPTDERIAEARTRARTDPPR